MKKFVYVAVHPIRIVCDHVVGEEHTARHRCVAGTIVMVCGVLIVNSATLVEHVHWLHLVTETIGNFVHALGATPFLEGLVKTTEASAVVAEEPVLVSLIADED